MSSTQPDFAARIHERFPEGLTGIFAIGGTRTFYILEQQRLAADPGALNFEDYGGYIEDHYQTFLKNFLDLGGQNAIITALSYLAFVTPGTRGPEYGPLAAKETMRLAGGKFQEFYKKYNVDPYFVGIDTLRDLPTIPEALHLAEHLLEFQRNWTYREGARKVIWEVASIPLYTFRNIYRDLDNAALDADLALAADMDQVNRVLYKHVARQAFGTDVPMPHFYLGTNKGGDVKIRTPLPVALTGGEYLRLFYTPYPSLYTTRETLQRVIEDVAFKERFHSANKDYSGAFTADLAQAEFEPSQTLSRDPKSTVGLSRKVKA